MDATIKKAWVKNLRSGQYRKGRGFLAQKSASATTGDKFCCLGVLCDMAVQAGVIPAPVETETVDYDGMDIRAYLYEKNEGSLPEAVRKWAGMTSTDVEYRGQVVALVSLNDGDECEGIKPMSHRKIADLIDASL